MALGINGRYLARAQPTGMQRAAQAIVDAVIGASPDSPASVFIGDRDRLAPSANLRGANPRWDRRSRIGAQLFEQSGLNRFAARQGVTTLLHPLQTCPVLHGGLRHAVTVHDLHFYKHPEWFGRAFRTWNRAITIPAIRRADAVITISDFVLHDVRQMLRIAPERSVRIYTPFFGSARTPQAVDESRPPSLLCINPFQPHKNLPRIFRAFRRLRDETPQLQLRLVGRPQENFAAVPELSHLLRADGVHLLGYLSDEALRVELEQCRVFCFPSLSEGFGLPVLEAAAAGAVTVTSRTTALPEIAGEGAVLVDPSDDDSVYEGLRQALLLSPAERSKLLARAQTNLARFHPAQSGRAYLRVLRALEAGAPLPSDPYAAS